jgi:hypothetical protein
MKMPDKDPNSIAGATWLVILAVACWGGLVRYLIDIRQSRAAWSWGAAAAQVIVSGFTGMLSGFISMESGLTLYQIFFAVGVCGAMGSIALSFFWERLTGVKNVT